MNRRAFIRITRILYLQVFRIYFNGIFSIVEDGRANDRWKATSWFRSS